MHKYVRWEQDIVATVFEEGKQNEATITQEGKPLKENVRILTRKKLIRQYEIFPDQAIDGDGDLIEETMMMAEVEPIMFDQAMNDSNWFASMQE